MGFCAMVALAATSCNKGSTNAFTAQLTQPNSGARTHIGTDNYLFWNSGDVIKVFDAEGNAYPFSTTDNNVKTATFTGEATLDATATYYAFYPAANANYVAAESKVELTLANMQSYAANSFANGTYPMAAVNEGTTFTFHSPCGLLAIPMRGTGTIGSIELTGKTGEPLAGQLLFAFASHDLTCTMGTTTQDKVTLDCGGITLSPDAATMFYFVVPSGVFAQGFTAVAKYGGTELFTLETTHANTIAAETIKLMPEVTVSTNSGTNGSTTDMNMTVGYDWSSEAETDGGTTDMNMVVSYGWSISACGNTTNMGYNPGHGWSTGSGGGTNNMGFNTGYGW